jgi:alcohol dehydrogenase class IV
VHSLAHPLSTECGMHHGTTNAILLPAVLEYNQSAVPDRIQHLASLFGGGNAAGRVRELNQKVGIKPRLRDWGVAESMLPALADKAVQDGCHQLNPRPCSREDLLNLYRQAY